MTAAAEKDPHGALAAMAETLAKVERARAEALQLGDAMAGRHPRAVEWARWLRLRVLLGREGMASTPGGRTMSRASTTGEDDGMPAQPTPQQRAIAQVRANRQITTDEMTDEQVSKLAVTQLTAAGIAAGDVVALTGKQWRSAWERALRRRRDDGAS